MTKTVAILITANGDATTPHFPDATASGDPSEPYMMVRRLTASPTPVGLEVPSPEGLVFWTDGLAGIRALAPNMIGSAVFAEMFGLPLHLICGPLLLTSGSYAEPRPLTPAQVDELSEWLSGELWIPLAKDC